MKKMNGYAVKRNQTKQGILVLYTIQYLYGNHFQNPTKESEAMNIKRTCCKDCIFFIKTQNGQRGGIKGKCRIRKPNEKRNGSATACRMFGRLTLDKKENES